MLSKPRDGWSTFQISEKYFYGLSFLTDIAFDWLDQAIHGMRTLKPFAVHGFCEPGRMVCMVSYHACYVVFERDDRGNKNRGHEELYDVDLSMIDFCKALYNDIKTYSEEWVLWNYGDHIDEDDDVDESDLAERRNKLLEKLSELDALIREKENCWDSRHCFF